MVKNLISIWIVFLAFNLSFSQDTESQVKQIRTWYKEIEGSLANCQKVVVEGYIDPEMDDGTYDVLTGYYDKTKQEFVKIELYASGDWMERWDSYYFHEKNVFFNFTNGYYAEDYFTAEEMEMNEDEYYMSGMEAKTLNAYENRLYFANGQCIRFLQRSKIIGAEEERDLKDVEQSEEEARSENYEFYVAYTDRMIEVLKGEL